MRFPRYEKQDEWSIATMLGASPLDVSNLPAKAVLARRHVSDVKAGFVADPFLLRRDGRFHLFFEVWNLRTRAGEIGLAVSDDGRSWSYAQTVLREPFHLSYPFVFESDGEVYMLPECAQSGRQHLYVAEDFPVRWRRAGVLIDAPLRDASPVRIDGAWWLFAGIGEASDTTLEVFFAPELAGPWNAHSANPVRTQPAKMCRPGGRPILHAGRHLLFTQDSSRRYGFGLRAYEVLKLSATEYAERELSPAPLLSGTGRGWNSHAMHHLDALQLAESSWLLATDGNHRTLLY